MNPRTLLVLLVALLAACAVDTAGPNDDPELIAGKGDVWDLARPLTLGTPITGHVDTRALELFWLDTDERDVIEIAVTRTSGSFDPRTALYTGGGADLSYDDGSFSETDDGNKKNLTATGGRHYVLVRANYYRGAGEFSLTASCIGGPCAGDFGPADDNLVHAGTCLERARSCALTRLGSTDVTDVMGAAALFDDCLAEQSVFDYDCTSACAIDGAANALCTTIVEALPFYASKSAQCRGLANDCLEECNGREEYGSYLEEDDFEFWMNSEPVCWNDIEYNGTCDEFARKHVSCGGSDHAVADQESFDTCMAWCGAISGAWGSDIDEMCGPGCAETVCTGIDSDCRGRCSGDDDCWRSCVDGHPRQGDDFSWGCDDL